MAKKTTILALTIEHDESVTLQALRDGVYNVLAPSDLPGELCEITSREAVEGGVAVTARLRQAGGAFPHTATVAAVYGPTGVALRVLSHDHDRTAAAVQLGYEGGDVVLGLAVEDADAKLALYRDGDGGAALVLVPNAPYALAAPSVRDKLTALARLAEPRPTAEERTRWGGRDGLLEVASRHRANAARIVTGFAFVCTESRLPLARDVLEALFGRHSAPTKAELAGRPPHEQEILVAVHQRRGRFSAAEISQRLREVDDPDADPLFAETVSSIGSYVEKLLTDAFFAVVEERRP